MGRALDELGIVSIPADSPQVKGRIERLWRTFQDRLVTELRLADARDLDAANRVLRRFLPRYNSKFVLPAAESESAYRTPDPDLNLSTILCLKHMRTAGSDNLVRFKGRHLQMLPSDGRRSYVRARVEVHERMNGCPATYHHGTHLTITSAPSKAPALRASGTKPPQLDPTLGNRRPFFHHRGVLNRHGIIHDGDPSSHKEQGGKYRWTPTPPRLVAMFFGQSEAVST